MQTSAASTWKSSYKKNKRNIQCLFKKLRNKNIEKKQWEACY